MAPSRRNAPASVGALAFFVVPGLLAFASGACSLINAPDEVNPGAGGSDGTGAAGAGADGGGGGEIGCETTADCVSLTNECATGECGPNKVCVGTPQPAGTPCGMAPAGSCDLADACDGNGMCANGFVPDGTFCEDCPAGPGNCALCNQGVCGDCSTRAALKTFRTPISASGWALTGDWKIYVETPPRLTFGPLVPSCSDNMDNDGDSLVDLQDPGCAGPEDPFEDQPAVCNDATDNDGDGLIDLADDGCTAAGDDTEWIDGPIRFPTPVLGTDGNRAHPYGYNGTSHFESSTATSPPTVLPDVLRFRSWHVDEGYNYDLKAVQVSTNGVSFTNVHICVLNDPMAEAFCLPSDYQLDRAIDDWDMIELDVPGGMIGQVGYVRFVYDTTDGCCDFERGWYIDALNFAQDCACADDAACAYATGECGTGSCDGDECTLTPQNQGAACTAASSSTECSMPTCGDQGWCETGYLPFEYDTCDSCADPDGECSVCLDSVCAACPIQSFSFLDTTGWVFTGDWSIQYCVAANSVTTNQAPCFPDYMENPGEPETVPSLGTDGSRTGAFPWVAGANEVESGTIVTGPTTIPATLTFKSWHQDRGGNDTFTPRDTKRISVSTDGGANWTEIVNCNGIDTIPFCVPSPANQNRSLTDWDDIEIPIPANLAGETGIFEFAYDTVDSGGGWERGWYIDDLNINRCDCYNEACVP